MKSSLELDGVLERKALTLPRYLVIPALLLAPWKLAGTTVIEGTLNGLSLGRRTIKRWDDERWFLEVPEALCRQAHVDTGDLVHVVLAVASEIMPAELRELLDRDPRAHATWQRLTAGQQRMLREEILAAKSPETRRKRSLMALHSAVRAADWRPPSSAPVTP